MTAPRLIANITHHVRRPPRNSSSKKLDEPSWFSNQTKREIKRARKKRAREKRTRGKLPKLKIDGTENESGKIGRKKSHRRCCRRRCRYARRRRKIRRETDEREEEKEGTIDRLRCGVYCGVEKREEGGKVNYWNSAAAVWLAAYFNVPFFPSPPIFFFFFSREKCTRAVLLPPPIVHCSPERDNGPALSFFRSASAPRERVL